MPVCKTPKRKVKRLRPLPSKLAELTPEMKDAIVTEMRESRTLTAAQTEDVLLRRLAWQRKRVHLHRSNASSMIYKV